VAAVAVLAEDSLSVEPGGSVVTQLRVRNTGEIVDRVSFEALGTAGPWATFDPPALSLFPDAEGTTQVLFSPPRTPSTRAGNVPFGVRVLSQEDPAGSAVAEGDLLVGRYTDAIAELVPRTTRGRTVARHQLTVTNHGNGPLQARLVGVDPDRRVRFVFAPPEVTSRPGGATMAAVEVRPRRRFLRGPSVTHAYRVRLDSIDQPPIEVDGAFLQEALLPKWIPRALLALAALAIAWLVFLRPSVQSAAKVAVADEVQQAAQLAASQAVAPALAAADQRIANVEKAAGLAPGGGVAIGGATTTTVPPPPFDLRLEATAKEQTPKFKVAKDRILSVTDVLLQNPAGDTGRVSIQRGDQVLFQLALESFRDLDFHFVTPLLFPAESELRFKVDCANKPPVPPPAPSTTAAGPTTTTTTAKPAACTPALYLNGSQASIPPPPAR
jgi:hypothetical protein